MRWDGGLKVHAEENDKRGRERYKPERVRERKADERSEKVSGLRDRDSGKEG
jgi:hypothetical protein